MCVVALELSLDHRRTCAYRWIVLDEFRSEFKKRGVYEGMVDFFSVGVEL